MCLVIVPAFFMIDPIQNETQIELKSKPRDMHKQVYICFIG